MRILILADPGSSHTVKWVKALDKIGIKVRLLGLPKFATNLYANTNANVESLSVQRESLKRKSNFWKTKNYLRLLPKAKKVIRDFQPDILHAHYASSYGVLGALTGFRPFIVSVWGSDVFEFGEKSSAHAALLKYTFRKCDRILSTSKNMAVQTKKFTDADIGVIPFGVTTNKFGAPPRNFENEKPIVIGTTKSLEHVYGIDLLLKAFSKINQKNVLLRIVGSGSKRKEYESLAAELGISANTTFVGKVSPQEVPNELAKMHIFVAASRAESFGVAIVEASAAGLPVVASNVGGLSEVVVDNKTGFLVNSEDTEDLVKKIELLINSPALRFETGLNGRKFVNKQFHWDNCVTKIVAEYNKLCNTHTKHRD